MSYPKITLLVWLCVISVFSVAVTAYDKAVAKKPKKRRVSEKMLFLSALFGGSVTMYLTMLLISHKTKHKRFMLGIPIMIIAQYCIIWYFVRFA